MAALAIQFETLAPASRIEGTGCLAQTSPSVAIVNDVVGPLPEPGSTVGLRVPVAGQDLRVVGRVSRCAAASFTISFQTFTPALSRLVEATSG